MGERRKRSSYKGRYEFRRSKKTIFSCCITICVVALSWAAITQSFISLCGGILRECHHKDCCPVVGSSEIIYAHCKMMHNHSVTNFDFYISFVVSLRVDYESFVVLQENKSNDVFVLHNNSQPTGNSLTLCRLGPDDRCVRLEALAGNFQSIESYNSSSAWIVFGGSRTFVVECFTNLDIIVYADTAMLPDPLQDDSDFDIEPVDTGLDGTHSLEISTNLIDGLSSTVTCHIVLNRGRATTQNLN
ncbi:uncharacterized protein LOC126681729 [Mercurialis annua]|uniref:uncharacterized protein LOC126681729 n=1 Tax=Mercurialis annua TaxID=3986 RepID=UPI00215EDAD3|nr:uncharacterized protein LOC126681729 [Mercurialis annua]